MRKIFTVLFLGIAMSSFSQEKDFTAQWGQYSTKYAQEVINHMTHKKFKGREAGTRENNKIME
ncbi:MAG: hypothetical protein IIW47_03245, partial [Bacteroidales bacterium]|nr:hypothetical protein [Bacteroidales bacterium]